MRSFPRVVLVLVVLTAVSLVYADKVCPNCGAHNPDNAKFCKVCGAKLPEAAPAQTGPSRVAGSVSVDGPIVRITSDPLGAGVNVDGHSRGRTPLELNDLEPGRHQVELTRSGYRPFDGDFTIAGLFGSLVVTTDPVGAEVLLDSVSRGTVTDGGLALVRVPYGRHTITARLRGYHDAIQTVDLNAAGPIGVTCRLGYGKGWLVVNSDPPGASLFVNDKTAGKTPYVAELEPATYTLSVLRRGYYDWTGDASIQSAESTTVRALLYRIETRKLPLLAAAIVGLGGGAASAFKGQSEYAKYQAASTPEDARKYHKSTMEWDIGRDAAFLAGIAFGGAYWMLKW
jgi:ribosomal protein L40E